MIRYSAIGAVGYVCGEMLRMMVAHPEGKLVNVLDSDGGGDPISLHHPALRGFYDQKIMDLTEENVKATAEASDVVFIQVPSGDVPKWAEIVLGAGKKIIDIGADIRFRDVAVWEKWYGQKHPNPEMTHNAVYCIPEVMRDLAKGKSCIANPGCYPTASTLGLMPMLETGDIVENTIVIDSKSGYTGGYETISADGVDDLDGMNGGELFGRDTTRSVSSEHRGILHGDKLAAAITKKGYRTDIDENAFSELSFNSALQNAGTETAASFSCAFSSRTDTRKFTYQSDDGKYHTNDWKTHIYC